MPEQKHAFLLLAGVGTIAALIGLLTGISASPVVSVLIPLLFGLTSAVTSVLALRKTADYEATARRVYPPLQPSLGKDVRVVLNEPVSAQRTCASAVRPATRNGGQTGTRLPSRLGAAAGAS